MNISNTQRATYWQRHVEQWTKSGLSQSSYCAKHGLKTHQMIYWRARLLVGGQREQQSMFIEVPPPPAPKADDSSLGVQIVFPSGIMIDCHPSTNVAWLATLAGKVYRM